MGSFKDLAHPFFKDEIKVENFEKVLTNFIEGVKLKIVFHGFLSKIGTR
jgi:hypothetical protein